MPFIRSLLSCVPSLLRSLYLFAANRYKERGQITFQARLCGSADVGLQALYAGITD